MPILNPLTINTLRFLSIDAIEKANSGHPGLPMGAAPMALALWSEAMKHNPKNPSWPDRDRFVLSAGHGSALLYSLLHVFGYGVSIEDIKQFRQLDSKTPGHPEYRHTPGVEITTGPLGQGVANAVGFAWAESYLAARFNKPGIPLVDHYTYALCGDGCMMEGMGAEAVSLAGTLKLGKLIILYDSNDITIEGPTETVFTEDVGLRFKACGWDVHRVEDGNDTDAILAAIKAAKANPDQPSLIEVKTTIGYGSPNKQGTKNSHGAPLGKDEVQKTRDNLKWKYGEFVVPDEVYAQAAQWQTQAQAGEDAWNARVNLYKTQYPNDWQEWEAWHASELPVSLDEAADLWRHDNKSIPTRQASGLTLNKLCKLIPNLLGGSADLEESTFSGMDAGNLGHYSPQEPFRRNLRFGIREHAMTAIANAMAAHGGLRPYVSGFFVFSDYMKPAMRMAALMSLPVIHIMTHDSIGVGEDGPTHQPVEHLSTLRGIPNFVVIRPCDTNETIAAWVLALKRTQSPTALVLSRQALPQLAETGRGLYQGAYIIKDSPNPDVILMASGSEVEPTLKACDLLAQKGINARVVSFPSFELFDEQDDAYKESVLPKAVRKRVAVEAGASLGWHKYTGLDGAVISVDRFGASAPPAQLFAAYGFTAENIAQQAISLCKEEL